MRIIETLDQFMEWVKPFNDWQHLFRGLSKKCYELEASACRRLTPVNYNVNNLLDITRELISDARDQGHDEKNGRKLHDLELLAELQHIGAATCLIDFSRSALVALWFACQESSREPQEDGKVCAIRSDDTSRFKTITHDLVEKGIDCFFKADEIGKYPLYQWVPKPQNNRIIAQHSVFIFGASKIDADFECVIKREKKQEILRNLDRLFNINETSMFLDLHGFARRHADNKPRIAPDFQTYFQRGIDAHQKGDLDDAIRYYSNVIKLNPTDSRFTISAYTNRGNVYSNQGNWDQAKADYDRAIELDPSIGMVYYNRGKVYSDQGNFDQAIADYTKAIALDPNDAASYNNRGFAYAEQGNFDQAIADYNRAIALDPDHTMAYNNRGKVYNDQGNFDQAIADYNRAIALDPSLGMAYNNRGIAHRLQGNFDQAIADCDRAIELNPDYATAYNNRGNVYSDQGNWDQAIAEYTKAIALNPSFGMAYSNRGAAYAEQGNWDQAIAEYTKAIALNPSFGMAYSNRGVAYAEQGNWDQAIAEYNRAIELDPDYATAYYNRSIAYTEQGNSDLAEADFGRAEELRSGS